MTDITERLRRKWPAGGKVNPDGEEAADEIERLRAELKRRDENEARNCINWGPCSQHDGKMIDSPFALRGQE